MVPGEWDITIYKGATWRYVIRAEDTSGPIIWAARYDQARLQIRKRARADVVLHELTLGDGITFSGPDMTLEISAAETSAFNFSSGVYALELSDTGVSPTLVDRWFDGSVGVSAEVVR